MRRLTLTAVAAALLTVPALASPPPWAHAAKPTTTTTVAPTTTTVGGASSSIHPVIDCGINPETQQAETPIGIVVDQSDHTIINPEVRNCQTGIQVQANTAGVVPDNVRIIADATQPGYTTTTLTHNRTGIRVRRATNLEIGDISAPTDQIGGALRFSNNYKHFEGTGTTIARIHHTTSELGVGSIYVPQTTKRGALWGYKWIANRSFGAPYEVAFARFDHNIVAGYFEEGLSFDSRGGNDPLNTALGAGTITGKGATTLTIPGIPTTESTINQYVIVNEGPSQAASLRITARAGDTFTVADPNGWFGGVQVGQRVTVGMRYYRNEVDHNQVDTQDVKTGIDFHGASLYGRIEANTMTGTPSFAYGTPFHIRLTGQPQCLMVRSMAGPTLPKFSLLNSVVGNHCQDAGDITASVISWGTYEVDSPTWMATNTFAGTPTGQEWRYKAPQPATDPTA